MIDDLVTPSEDENEAVLQEGESLLKFPCQFPIKAVGSGMLDLEKTVLQIMQRHVVDVSEGDVTSRQSSNGRFISVTIVITALSRRQLDAIYKELTDHQDIMMAF